MVYDVNMRRVDAIPTLQGSRAAGVETQNGIHAIQINPSRTLLATGARHSADIAVYRLPTLDPLCIGENSHRDWVIFIIFYSFRLENKIYVNQIWLRLWICVGWMISS